MIRIVNNKNFKYLFYLMCNILIYPFDLILESLSSFGTYGKLAIRLIPMFAVCLLYLIKVLKYKRINIYNILIFVLIIATAIISLSHRTVDIEGTLYQNSIIAFSLLCLVSIGIENDYVIFCKISYVYLYLIVVINILFSIVLNSEILAFLFTNKENAFIYNFPLILFGFILQEKKAFKKIELFNIISYFLIISWSIYTKTLGTFFSLTLLIVFKLFFNKQKYKILNVWIYIVVVVLFMVIFVLPGANNPFMNIVSRLFGKELGFSGRDVIYGTTINSIKNSLLFGYGFISTEYSMELTQIGKPHNMFLDYLLYYGIILFVYYLYVIRYVIITIVKNNVKTISRFLLFALFCLYFKGMIESAMQDKVVYWLSLLYYFNDNYKDNYIYLGSTR